tara:strand:+ start:156 stop:551 length:396 start_codon:yes stop_codon:yes gene_type:complete
MSESVERLKKSVDLELLKPKHSLKKLQLANDLLVVLRAKILEYPASHPLKSCQEFILFCCKLIENLVQKKDKIDKKELLKDVFKQLFSLQAPELLILDATVEFLWSNDLICKIPLSKKSINWFKKKVSCFL